MYIPVSDSIMNNFIKLLTIIVGLFSTASSQDAANNVCTSLGDYATIDFNPNCYYDPDVGASPVDIINRYGYPFESFELTTEDDYDIRLMRIPREGATPVLLVNGIMANSLSWLGIGNESLAFKLYDAGYDVWIANCRGTLYASNNIEDKFPNEQFWDFSFYEMGYYDLPVFLEFIRNLSTSSDKIIYIGHSMGTTCSYVYAITRKDHASEHLRAILSLAPVAFMGGQDLSNTILGWLADPLKVLANSLGIYNIGYYNNAQKSWFDAVCFHPPTQIPCVYIYQLIVTAMLKEVIAPESLPIFAGQFPSGTALKSFIHYGQLIRSNQFQNYDYGVAGNTLRYGSPTPPQFDISRINVPVYLYCGTSDEVTNGQNTLRLYDALTTTKNITEVPVAGSQPFTHMDFVMSRAKAPLLYRPVLDQLSLL